MKLKILEANELIGEAEVFALDPPMGVAMAKFTPTHRYDISRHANVIDGDYVGDRGAALHIEISDGSTMKSRATSIQDFPSIDERQVDVLVVDAPSFDELFRAHPSYDAYYGQK